MQARYGLDRRPVGRWIAIGVIAVAALAAFAWVTFALIRPTVDSRLITWSVVGPDRADLTFEIDRAADGDVTCVVRGQDEDRVDVGYATVVIPAGASRVSTTYSMRTLAPAYTVELLGCAFGDGPRVPPPQFPAGVIPPAQPY